MADMNRESKLLVCLFSDPNFLAITILENLLAKNCLVKIVTGNKRLWSEKTQHISQTGRFSFIGLEEYKQFGNFSYAIFCGGFLKKETAYTDFKKFISNKNFGDAKTLAIFPFETFSLKRSSKIAISGNAGIIYLGDLMGPRIDLSSDLLVPSLINEMVTQRSVTLGVGELFYPLFIADAGRVIVKWLLSFGPYGKDTFLLGKQVSSGDFWKQNLKSFPDLKILYDTDIETRFIPKGYETQYINSNLNICLNETYKWIIKEKISGATKQTKNLAPKKAKIRKPSRLRFLRPFLIPFFVVLFFPLITSIISGGLLYLSYKQFLSEKIPSAQNTALLAKTVFVIGKSESDLLSILPLIGKPFKETSYISKAGETLSDMAVNAMPILDTARSMVLTILGTGVYDVKAPSQEIKTGMEYIYKDISIFEIITKEKAGQGVLSAKQVLQVLDLAKLKTLSRGGSLLAGQLPLILGADTDKNYLVLFENNMELRPTGGFVGSYGIANFGGGKLNGLTINDIYSADGQLKGHIEPPAPIKTYLNEANWWFRDSNWDPDFPTSAERAEWFLGKEMNQNVDGVIAVDLEPIKSLLKYTGPIFLPDYNLTVNSDNLYEKTQEEAQSDFFPGSRKKASFLTALSRSLLGEVPKLSSINRVLTLKALYESLNGRHIQVYLHDQNSEAALDSLAWDGKIQSYSCGDSCYSDFFGDVEANVGVNKSNYFVSRKFDFKVNISPQKISRQLTISLTNSSNPSLGPSGVYKPYLRLLIPTDSELLGVKVVSSGNEKILTPDITREKGRQEVGVYFEMTPGQKDDIEFMWQNTISPEPAIKSYGLFVRKQAGVDADPITVQFTGTRNVQSQPVFSLTKEGVYTYNTALGKDLFARLTWK
jgi:hypothetical protein